MNYDDFIEFATVRELEYIEAIKKHDGQRAAAKVLGVSQSSISEALKRLERRATIRNFNPKYQMHRAIPDGLKLKGGSTLYRKGEIEPVLEWVKTSVDEERREQIMRETVSALSSSVKGLAPLSKKPSRCLENLLTVYPLGDPHIGLYAWAKESGEDFDLSIAESLTLGAVDRLVEVSPASRRAIILPLGDIFHANDQSNTTPAHKHQLDVDGRFVKVLHVGVKIFRHAIMRCLEKHDEVVVRFVTGNHDPQAAWALAFTIAAYFENDPRVTVDLDPSAHWFYRFGSVLLGATHGDKSRAGQLPGVMACDRAKDWGETLHRYWLCGHIHTSNVTEYPGVSVETFRTLAARDAYAAGHGYRAGRDMRSIVFHKDHGEIERHRCDVGMI